MFDGPTKRRLITDDDLEWVIEHEREVQAFREHLLARDGHVCDTTTREIIEVVDE